MTTTDIRANVSRVIHGQDQAIELALTCMLAEGHLLMEDVPGVGKTSLARALAASIGGVAHRIQFTPDLLPSDVTGVSIYNQNAHDFEFHPGPIFGNVVIADEINRASPKTQSALLEVMGERRVTVDGVAHPVPRPFMVVATQNPIDMDGTYRLPEAQMDRFLMRISLGYPDHDSEIAVISTHSAASSSSLESLVPVATVQSMLTEIQRTDAVYVARPIMDYVVDIATATRNHTDVRLGVSPRGSLALVRAARARAVLRARDYVTSDDVKALAECVLGHRIIIAPQAELRGETAVNVLREVLAAVPTPEGHVV